MTDPHPISAPNGDADNVDKIRDILFGSQMRDYERRFVATEERLGREASALRDDLGRRLVSTEQFMRSEFESLNGTLRAEERDRLQGVREAMAAVSSLNQELSERLAQLEATAAQQHESLGAQLRTLQQQLTEQMDRRSAESGEALARETARLRDDKADRSAIAGMFAEFARRLSEPRDHQG